MQMVDKITLFLYAGFLFHSHLSLPPFSLCRSQLSDKRCLLAINPGGVLTGVPIKRSIFSLFGGFVRGPEEVR